MSGILLFLGILVGVALGATLYFRRARRNPGGSDVDPDATGTSPDVR